MLRITIYSSAIHTSTRNFPIVVNGCSIIQCPARIRRDKSIQVYNLAIVYQESITNINADVEKSLYSPEQRALQALLRQVRQEAGLTQVELAQRLEIGQAIVSNYERGERRLDFIELCKVCEAIGIDVREFIDRFLAATSEKKT